MPSLYESISKNDSSNLKALYYENKSFSFKKLLINIRKMITFFKEKGIKKGDVVTVVLPNIPANVYAFYALNAMGVIQNIVHPLTKPNKIIETMINTNSKYAVVLATTYQEAQELYDNSSFTFFFANPTHDKSLLTRHLFYAKFKKVKENNHLFLLDKFHGCKECHDIESKNSSQDSIYLHSGGTTGIPKVIALSDDAINNLASKVNYKIINQAIKGKSMLVVLPTFHGFGLGMGVHAPLYNGACSALMMKFNSTKIIKWINQGKINYIIGVPLLYQKLMRDKKFKSAKLSNLEYCFIGGDNVPISLIKEFNSLMKDNGSSAMLLEGYGLTETVTVCCVNTKENCIIGSVGKPLVGINIKVLDNNLNELKSYEIGEVYISGDTTMNGYLNDIEATKDTIVIVNNTKYVKTGDLGYFDDEGFLFIKGRKKRMFKISGINVYPSEIEKIATDKDDIIEASLEFFENPKPHLVLFVIKNKYSSKTEEMIKEEIYHSLKDNVLNYSLPKDIIFMDKFPQTNVGKIDHKAFKDPTK